MKKDEKYMTKQKGFSLVEGLLIVLILCVVCFAGWFVWDSNETPDASQNETTKNQEVKNQNNKYEPISEKTIEKTITHSTLGFGAVIPSGWDASEVSSTDTSLQFNSIELKTSDFVLDTPEVGYEDIKSGARISIKAYPSETDNTSASDLEVYKSSDSTYKGKVNNVTVDGTLAVMRIWAYEGMPNYGVRYYKNGVEYYISLETAIINYDNLEAEFAPYLDTFNIVVESFKFNQ